jgi:serine/threonine protein kinase
MGDRGVGKREKTVPSLESLMVDLGDPAGRRGPRAGDVLGGRYRLDDVLGAGGTADVFRALDLTLRREVAVKVFRPGTTAVSVGRFCEEAVLLGRLAHPALVAVYDAGRYLGGAYVVMQLVQGVTLRQRLTGSQPTSAQVARLGAQLASALAHAHAAGIVHRDVKPSNVLVGPGDAAYLTDFGISRPIDEPTRAEPGTVVGTVPYLAPEQILGKGSSPASDVYALGLVLLEALKGEREYQGAPMEAGTARLLRSPEIPQWVPAGLASVIEAMTRSEPAERPDAARCAHLLEAATDGARPGVPDSADTTTHRNDGPGVAVVSGPRPKRHRRRTVVAATAAALVLGGTGVALLAVDGSPSTPDADTRQSAPAGGFPGPTATTAAGSPPAKPAAHTSPSRSVRTSPPPQVSHTAGASGQGRNPGPGAVGGPGPSDKSKGKDKADAGNPANAKKPKK